MTLKKQQGERLKVAAEAAVRTERQFGLPAEVTVGQWAEESGWGRSQPGNNPFGIKTFPGDPDGQMLETTEEEHGQRVPKQCWFKKFPTLEAAFERRGRLLTLGEGSVRKADLQHIWAEYLEIRDWRRWLLDLAPIYCTNTAYAGSVQTIANLRVVQAAIAAARVAQSGEEKA